VLVGYVSDEQYLALADVSLEFEQQGQCVTAVRSTSRGGVYAEIEPGDYRVTLARAGFGSKGVDVRVEMGRPHQFRLLSDGLLGYVWPKWVKSGEKAEFRVHVELYRLSLWRYGWQKEFFQGG
jgi:N,N-dimethylformamidase